MHLRSPRERIIQTMFYEAGGLLMALPLYILFTGTGLGDGGLVMLAMAAAEMLWAPIHNTAFDWADLRLSGRLASDRPQRWRAVHAFSYETSAMVASLPVLIWLGGHGLWEAIFLDVGLTLAYTAYAYVFHIGYDRLRPVRAVPERPVSVRPVPVRRFPGYAFAS